MHGTRAFEAHGQSLKCFPEDSVVCDFTQFLGLVPSEVICISKQILEFELSFINGDHTTSIDYDKNSKTDWKCISVQGWNTVNLVPKCSFQKSINQKFTGDEVCFVSFDISELNRDITIFCVFVILLSFLCFLIGVCTISLLVYNFYKKKE